MSFLIENSRFQGPMELLVELIRKREMDIYDIEIHILVDDFIDYMKTMESLEMEVTADFISMTAYLLKIKSQMLVPNYIIEEEEIIEEDPREELVSRILEYERMKEASLELKKMEEYENLAIYRQQEDFSYFSNKELLKNLKLEDLIQSFNEVMKRYDTLEKAKDELEKIPMQDFTLEEAQSNIYILFEKEDKISFSHILASAENKGEVITYFLSVLELMKSKFLEAWQEDQFSEITLRKRGE